jgi:hypothetical protein
MSGAIAAHSAHNGSGTQGTATTKIASDNDPSVMSVFYNKNDVVKQMNYGSSLVEIPSSGTSTVNFGGSRLFFVNTDIDCLGDMFLELTATLPTYAVSGSTTPANVGAAGNTTTNLSLKPFALQTLIESVKIQVGSQTWQTIEKEDLRVVNSTELGPDAFGESSVMSTPPSNGTSANTTWLVIPSLTKTLGPVFGKFSNHTEDGYPMVIAPSQQVKVEVTFVEAFPTVLNYTATDGATAPPVNATTTVLIKENVPYTASLTLANSGSAQAVSGVLGVQSAAGSITSCKLYAKQQIMCNAERTQLMADAQAVGIPKRLKMTQNAYTTDLGSSDEKTIELDHFSLYASHLIITGNLGDGVKLASAELKLNSSSFSGRLPGVLLDYATSDSLGLFANKYIYQTGTVGNNPTLEVEEFGMGTYVFPLASTAYSGSSVPLNRFDSIRLVLKFTSKPLSTISTFVNVTCVGETTALFKGGAASLAMY